MGGCCSSILVPFKTIEDVKSVPGTLGKVDFATRFNYWRRCCLFAILIFGFVYVLCTCARLGISVVRVQETLKSFPDSVRPLFTYYVWAMAGAEILGELIVFWSIRHFANAFWDRHEYAASKKSAWQGWAMLFLGPFASFLFIPFGSTLRTDILQRDLCAAALGGFNSNSMSRVAFGQAALTSGETDLAQVALYPPVRIGNDGYDTWQGTIWCNNNKYTWLDTLFGTEWVNKAASGDLNGDSASVAAPFTVKKVGVVPQTLRVMSGFVGMAFDPGMGFCASTTPAGGKKDDYTIKEKSLLQIAADGDEAHRPNGGPAPSWLPTAGFLASTAEWLLAPSTLRLDAGAGPDSQAKLRHANAAFQAAATPLLRSEPRLASGQLPQTPVQHQMFSLEPLPPGPNELRAALDKAMADFAEGEASIHGQPAEDTAALLQLGQEAGQGPGVSMAVAKAVGVSAICAVYRLGLAILQISRLSGVGAVQMAGLFSTALCFKALFMGMFSVVDGLVVGVVNVKKVLHRSCLPGYLLQVAVLASLPPMLLVLCCMNQLVAHPLFGGAMVCLATWRYLDLWRADIMQNTSKPKRMLEEFTQAGKWQMRMQIFALLFLIAFAIRMLILIKNGQVSMGMEMGNIDVLSFLQQPVNILCPLFKFLLTRVATAMVSTDIVLLAIFDAADDRLKVDGEKGDDLIEGWCKVNGIKNKKKKKKDKESAEDEFGYADDPLLQGAAPPPMDPEGGGAAPAEVAEPEPWATGDPAIDSWGAEGVEADADPGGKKKKKHKEHKK